MESLSFCFRSFLTSQTPSEYDVWVVGGLLGAMLIRSVKRLKFAYERHLVPLLDYPRVCQLGFVLED
jgi:hypothetical protein